MKLSAYHGTNKFFKEFDFGKIGQETSGMNYVNIGACFTPDCDYAMDYAINASGAWNGTPIDGEPIVLKAHLTLNATYEATNSDLESVCESQESADAFKAQLISEGYDSIKNYCSTGGIEYICFYPEQIHILNKGASRI